MQIVKIMSASMIVILIFLLIMLALGWIKGLTFWIPLALIAIFAYGILPRLKKQ